jgi:hypothetical protein
LQASGTICFCIVGFTQVCKSILNSPSTTPQDSANVTLLRRRNVQALFQRYAESQMAQGIAPKGIEQAFAAALEISPSLWSQIKSSRPIGDKLARQIEKHAKQPALWLDAVHEATEQPDAAELRFLELAQQVWRQSNAKGKRVLLQTLRMLQKQ